MRIVTNHLTRMATGYVCVAGIDLDTGKHVRPVLRGRIEQRFSGALGGPFDIGSVVDLGRVQYVGEPPETEDHRFDLHGIYSAGHLRGDRFWDVLDHATRSTFSEIFGPQLRPKGRTFAVDEGQGRASLGLLTPKATPRLIEDRYGKLRLEVQANDFRGSFSLTDLRMYDRNFAVDPRAVAKVKQKLARRVPVILGVGLTRPWQKPGDSKAYHWLQINNLHFADEPLWLSSSRSPKPLDVAMPFLDPAPVSAPQLARVAQPAAAQRPHAAPRPAPVSRAKPATRFPEWLRSVLRFRERSGG